jgi:hypothetical protein
MRLLLLMTVVPPMIYEPTTDRGDTDYFDSAALCSGPHHTDSTGSCQVKGRRTKGCQHISADKAKSEIESLVLARQPRFQRGRDERFALPSIASSS